MDRTIWNGTGEVGNAAYFTKHNGEIVGRPYVRARVRKELGAAVLAYTVDDDAWMR